MSNTQYKRLTKITNTLGKLYYNENVDPKGPRVCKALDIICEAASKIQELENEEYNEIKK